MTRDRLYAAGAGLAVLVGASTMLVAVVVRPGSWLAGYVSEAGTSGQPFALAYRCGLVLLAVGVGLLALALRRLAPLAMLLALAAVLAGTSGVVPCTTGCPLPPHEPTTPADVVHTAASIAGLVTLAAAMLVAMLAKDLRPATRRLAACALTLTVPLGGSLGMTMLLAGRGALGASLERLLLVVAVSWLIGTSLLTLLRNSVKVESWQMTLPSANASRR